ncbi:hypothetical protein [Streptomyces sp. AK04-3B]|uniref:hypothetical protein n=1 Tax=Streptomyces sp. AK04-3B TaxID=3028650 RepID=UPI0029BBC2D6|nr:hypothetical protein [Streptomyces sp. AK04-3B]MDX3800614.1 hypothetical protein [Streptomyces sp. AK04-3B]
MSGCTSDDKTAASAAGVPVSGSVPAVAAAAGGESRGQRYCPVRWLLLCVLACVVTFIVWLCGIFSGGLDVGETCALRGQTYDDVYRSEHWREPSRFFPLHDKCNASYDLVPVWINPALVLFALVAAGSLLAACWTTFVRVRRSWRRRRTAPAR